MDGTNETSAGGTSVSVGRYSLRSEQNNNFSGNDDQHLNEHHDNNGGSSDNSNEPPLSEYELLRLRKIKRNEARLAQLGLLVPSAATKNNSNQKPTHGGGGEASSSSSALTTLFLSSSDNNNKKKKRQKTQDDITSKKRRILPRRHCTTTSSRRFKNNDIIDGYTSDASSIAASPIIPKRILTLQPHQAAAVAMNDANSASGKEGGGVPPRREKRGRPRREDYVYKCDEVCGHCGGEWRLDGDDDVEEDTRLIRCKDCRGAFHLDCMMLHGKNDDKDEMTKDEASGSCKENNSTLQKKDKRDQANARVDANIVPKRCFQCECNKSKRAKRKGLAPALEAIVGKKLVTVRISLELPLEAVVRGKNVMCYVTLENS